MNLTYTRPGELRKPDVKVLPDGRIRVTRYIAAGHGDRDLGEITQSFGASDGGLSTALLVEKGMARIEGKDAIVKTWEVRNPTGETPVGNEDVQWGENGLKTVIADFVQMSTQPYTPQTVGTTASTYDATCILRNEVMEDDGSTRQIRRFYINKGLLKQVDDTRNNGALLIRTLTYLNDTPAAGLISGYTLINQNRDNPSGLPTTTYTYAKGNGLVDKNAETRLSGMLLRTTLTYLTDPSVTTNPTTDPFGTGGTVINTDTRDADGHRIWTVIWVKPVTTSNISDSVESRNKDESGNPQLVIYRRKKLGTQPATPAPTIGGTVVIINDSSQLEDGYTLYERTWAEGKGVISNDLETRNSGMLYIITSTSLAVVPPYPTTPYPSGWLEIDNSSRIESGVTIYTKRWARGAGVIEQRSQPREGGLRIETFVSLGNVYDASYMKPIGIIAAKDLDYLDGYTRWTVSCYQLSTGADPLAGEALNYTISHPFTYPGRAKAFSSSQTFGGGVGVKTNYDVFKSPPVTALVEANVSVSYQASPLIGTINPTLWNPTTWASIRSWYLGWNAAPGSVNESLPNYRADAGYSSVSSNGGTSGYQESYFGNRVYGLGGLTTPYYIQVTGGPNAPDGNTYTIATPTLEPAFIGYDGTTWRQYYRRTIVYATIPAQPALPV